MLPLLGPAYQLAIAVIILAFLFTCVICGFSLFIIFKTPHLRASAFGDICAVQMVSDLTLITLNTVWCLLKAWSVSPVSNQSRLAMVVGVASKTLYFFTCKLHVLMAINRYVFIFHATDNQKSTSLLCKVAILICFILAFLQSVAGPLLDSSLFIVFSSVSLQWHFAITDRTQAYQSYLEYYVVLAECTMIIVLNAASFIKLKQLHRMITKSKCTSASEQRLLMQSVCQLIPLSSVMLLFFVVTPLCQSEFLAFLCSTATWHFGIALDGVIIVIFQAKFQCGGVPGMKRLKVST